MLPNCWKCGGLVIPLSDDWKRCQNCGREPDYPRLLTDEYKAEAEYDQKKAKVIENQRWRMVMRTLASSGRVC